MPLLKPFRALRYDPGRAGPLDELVSPPHDVMTPELRERLLAASSWNAVRLVRPETVADAARDLAAWRSKGILVRDDDPALWILEETFTGPDSVERTRRGLVARVRLEPYSEGGVLPHERTFEASTRARLELLRTTRAKLSPILLLHAGEGPSPPVGEPDLEATLDGTTSRLWRLDEPGVVETVTAGARRPLVIADGHHRYEAARRYHEEEGTDETSHVLAVLVSRDDSGLVVFPTHRVAAEEPVLNGGFRETEVPGGAIEGLERLAALPRDRAAFVVLRAGGAFLAEGDPTGDPVADLDATAVDRVTRGPVEFTPDAADAEAAVVRGTAAAAFLVRPPTVDQIEAVALAGETMPQKSTYFFPKLLAGLVFSPFDE